MANISIEQLSRQIANELSKYSQDIVEGIDTSSEETAKKAVKKLKDTSPKDSKKYSKGWKVKTDKNYGQANSLTIYNKNKHQLTHLLEHGHAKAGGGRVEAKPHIGPVEQDVIKEFVAEVERVIKGG